MSTTKYRRLQELDHSNFEIVKGDSDIRGWDVRFRNGEKIGSVEELILDAKAKKVRYMVVDLDENELRLEHRKIVVPIGLAELDKEHDDVLMPNVSVDQLCTLPEYKRDMITPDVERNISATLGRKAKVEPIISSKKETREERREMKEERKEEKRERKLEGEDYDDVDPDFYSHEHYNTDNLYKNRLHEAKRI